METGLSADPGPGAQRTVAPSVLLGWITLGVGLVGSALWVWFAQGLGDTISIESIGMAMSVYYALLFVPLVAIAFLLGMVEHRRVWRGGEAWLRRLVTGSLLGLGGLGITIAFAAINGGLVRGEGGGIGFGLLLLGSGLTLFQVFSEELLFRGWLQPSLVTKLGPVAGIGFGALLFAAFHLSAGVRAPVSLINLALGGVWFGLLAFRSGGLVAPLAAHFAWNVVEDLGFGLTPNPGSGPLGSVLDLDLAGLPIWGGQEEALNASIGTTIVLLALIISLLGARSKFPQRNADLTPDTPKESTKSVAQGA